MSKLEKIIGVKDRNGNQYSKIKVVSALSNNTEMGQVYAFVNRRNQGILERLMEITSCPFIVKDGIAYINKHTVDKIISLHSDF